VSAHQICLRAKLGELLPIEQHSFKIQDAAADAKLLLDNELATMGAGLPSATIAACLHPRPARPGGVRRRRGHDELAGLETADRLGLNLVVLILQDNAFGMIRWKQAVDGFVDYGMTFNKPDFVAYAGAYGIKGSRVNSADGLASALEAAFAGGGVHLVTVPVDYSENTRVLVDELCARAIEKGTRP
jgi:acetolactate synthase I/II/III large subunit